MAISAASINSNTADFNGNTAGSIETWVYTEVESQTSTHTTIRYVFGWDQGSSYSDNQDFDAWIDGDNVYSQTLNNSKGSGSWKFYETTRTYSRPLYGSPNGTHNARCRISGIFNGPTSDTDSHQVDTQVPDRGGTVLGPPGSLNAVSVTSSSISYTWTDPTNEGVGPEETDMYLELSTSPTFSSYAYYGAVGDVNSKTVTGLNRATTYYARVKALNAYGWGAWSSVEAATTSPTVPDAQAAPTVSNPTSSGFTVSFLSAVNGGSTVTSYEQQVSLDNFATVAASFTGVSPKVLTGLLPGKKYRARTRAVNGVGGASWSPASAEIQTLGGVKMWDGDSWEEAIVRNRNETTWNVVIVRKWNGSAWVV